MALAWYQNCGSRCGMGLAKERLVVFDAGGNIQAVFGDGETEVLVS